MDYSEKWGRDVDEAVKLALEDLKVSIDEVDVTVLEEPSRGFFWNRFQTCSRQSRKEKDQRTRAGAAGSCTCARC